MSYAMRLVAILLFLSLSFLLIKNSFDNHRLATEIEKLESELGRMSIEDVDRVHLVEIASPDVPPEVASHLERVWQFRCYLPSGYEFTQTVAAGEISKEGLFRRASSFTGFYPPATTPIHKMLIISLGKQNNGLRFHVDFDGRGGSTSWDFTPERLENSVVQKLVSSEKGKRTFDQDSIISLLKIYDPDTGKEHNLAGKVFTTYRGASFVLCPKSRQDAFSELERGITPEGFQPNWIASEQENE